MPSRKVISASLQEPLQRRRGDRSKSAYRISSEPMDEGEKKLRDDARASLDAFLGGTPFRNGVLRRGTFGTDANEIEHGLGSRPDGFIVVGLRPTTYPPAAPPVVYEVAPVGAARYDTHIRLACTEPADVILWIWRADGAGDSGA